MLKKLLFTVLLPIVSMTITPSNANASMCGSGGLTLNALISQGSCNWGDGINNNLFTLTFSTASVSGSPASPGTDAASVNNGTTVSLSSTGVSNLMVSFLGTFTGNSRQSARFDFQYSVVNNDPLFGVVSDVFTVQNARVIGVAALGGVKEVQNTYQTIVSLVAVSGFHDLTNTLSFPAINTTFSVEDTLELFQDLGFGPASAQVGDDTHQGALINSFTFASSTSATPEPFTMLLTGGGLLTVGLLRRRRKA